MSSSVGQRLQQMASQFVPGSFRSQPSDRDVDMDVVVVSALRTPITRSRRGAFRSTHPEELLAAVLKATLDRTGIDPALVSDVVVGNVLAPGGGCVLARMAALHAGLPISATTCTVNRQCASGLEAVTKIYSAIKAGLIEVGIGAGFESMTLHYGPNAMPSSTSDKITGGCAAANDCLLSMGVTSDNVAREFNVDRIAQDELAQLSHDRAAAAQKNGLFDEEIVPVEIEVENPDTSGTSKVVVSKDDGIRENVTMEQLAKLPPVFSSDGTTTAGNSSQVSDGAAAVLLMTRRKARALNLPVLGRFVTAAVVGVPPRVMGIGPVYAIPRAVENVSELGGVQGLDLIELNEAFASQATYTIKTLGLDLGKVNVKGGAIALGHPLGATGARQIATLLPELKRRGLRWGAVTMCVGTGMGMCAILERE